MYCLGTYIYKHVAGYAGVAEDARPLDFDATFYLASCTKLLASIASLQLIDRGLVKLDAPVDDILPELASQPVLEQKEDGTVGSRKALKSISLRHLLSHSSGTTYDFADPKLIAWRVSRGETPSLPLDGDVATGFAYPRTYEAGEGWNYSGGLDWASLLVARLTNQGFEEYVEENIAKPLGITTFTWHFARKPEVESNLMSISTRSADGTLTDGPTPFSDDPTGGEGGGAGCYSNAHDYTRVLADLLKDSPSLLSKAAMNELFAPQFEEGSLALAGLQANSEYTFKATLDNSLDNVTMNYGLGGLVVTEDVVRDDYLRAKGTLSWSGLPALLWGVNRERGLAFFWATQVVPWADRRSFEVAARFETAVWRNLKA
jgi:CubicO group peptidase (beta-lactamase class C family)